MTYTRTKNELLIKLIKLGLQSVLLLATIWLSSATGQTVQASSATPTQSSNQDAEQTAHILGLDTQLHRLLTLRSQRAADAPATLEELSIRQQLLESIQASSLDVDSVLAELENEQGELGTLKTILQGRRDKRVARLTTAALLTGSGLGTAVNATQFTTLSSTTQNVGDAIGIASGISSTILSILAARAQKGPNGSVGETPNMLAPILGGIPVLNTYYPPIVLQYLQAVPAGGEPADGTRLEQLKQSWYRAGRLSATDSAKRTQKIAVLTTSNDAGVKASIDDLTNRMAMLNDVRGRIALLKRDLATLMRSYMTTLK